MENPSLQIGNDNWAIKEDNLLGYSTAGTRFVPQPITMTRATLGTRVNPSGLVEDVALLGSELVTNGDFPSGTTAWTFGAGWSLGTNKAERLVAASSTDIVQASVFPNLTSTFKISFDVVRSAGSIRLRAGTYSLPYVSATDTYIYYVTPVSNDQLKFQADSSFVGSITNISVKEATIDNLPRVDYTDGTSSLLVEPQSTNLIPNANQYAGNTVYYTVTPNQSSPDGENNATLFVEKTVTANYSVTSDNASIVGGQTYAYSFFVKYAGKQNIPVNATDGVSGFNANIDILNGTVNSGTAEIKNFGNGWFRVLMTRTAAASASNAKILFNFGNQTGDGTSGFYLFGYQIEQLSYATSYIKTSGSTVTRNQETYTKTGISDKIGQTEGTFFIELSKPVLEPDSYYLISLNNAASNSDDNSVAIGFENSNDFFLRVQSNGTDVFYSNNFDALNVNTFYKIAVSYKSGQSLIYIDGSPITPNGGNLSNAFAFTATLDNLSFDFNGNNGLPFYGKVKQLQVFKTALTDSELETLTT